MPLLAVLTVLLFRDQGIIHHIETNFKTIRGIQTVESCEFLGLFPSILLLLAVGIQIQRNPTQILLPLSIGRMHSDAVEDRLLLHPLTQCLHCFSVLLGPFV